MSRPHRCKLCNHRPGRRITTYSKGGDPERQHKKPCNCECHHEATTSVGASDE